MSKKKWGQNFLKDKKVIESIIKAANIQINESILEIGPGHGILTKALLEKYASVTSVEIDPKLCLNLKKRFGNEERFNLIEMDVMKIPPEELSKLTPQPSKIVANLPYNIVSSLLLRILPVRKKWQSLTLMVQKEVAERICATSTSGKTYGPLSFVGELGFEREIIKIIPPEKFKPAPKVNSAIIRLFPKDSALNYEGEKLFLWWNQILFQQRRKTLSNGIRQHFPEWYHSCGNSICKMFGMSRPENLSFDDWIRLFRNYLKNENLEYFEVKQ